MPYLHVAQNAGSDEDQGKQQRDVCLHSQSVNRVQMSRKAQVNADLTQFRWKTKAKSSSLKGL